MPIVRRAAFSKSYAPERWKSRVVKHGHPADPLYRVRYHPGLGGLRAKAMVTLDRNGPGVGVDKLSDWPLKFPYREASDQKIDNMVEIAKLMRARYDTDPAFKSFVDVEMAKVNGTYQETWSAPDRAWPSGQGRNMLRRTGVYDAWNSELASRGVNRQRQDTIAVNDDVERYLQLRTSMSMHDWAKSSADAYPTSIALHRAAAERFGVPDASMRETGLEAQGSTGIIGQRPWDRAGEIMEAERPYFDAFLDATYARTQAWLDATYPRTQSDAERQAAAWGAKNNMPNPSVAIPRESFPLYRGIAVPPGTDAYPLDPDGQATIDVRLRPLSSFSTSQAQAQVFTSYQDDTGQGEKYLLGAEVPRERIFSTSATGLGAYNEEEWIVVGGEPEPMRVWRIDKGENYHADPDTEEAWEAVGVDADDIVKWKDSGVDTAAEAAQWQTAGFSHEWVGGWVGAIHYSDPAQAATWIAAGFDQSEYEWRVAFDAPYKAKPWKDAGYDATDAQEWYNAAVAGPAQAQKWEDAGFSANEAGGWLNSGFRIDEAKVWAATNATQTRSPNVAAGWKSAGFSAYEADAWATAGFSATEAQTWIAMGFDHAQAKRFVDLGISPGELGLPWAPAAAEYLTLPGLPPTFADTLLEAIQAGHITPEQASDYLTRYYQANPF